RLFELLLLEQSPAEDELGVADLVEVVDPAAQKIECVPRLLLRELRLARAQVDLRKRRDDVAGIGVIADLEENPIGVLEVLDRLFGLSKLEVESAEVVQELADIRLVGELLVLRLGALRVRTSEHPVARALGDQRSLEVVMSDRAPVVQAFCELQRTLDVLARGFPVALAPIAAGAPAEGARAKAVGGKARALGELQGFAEE